MDVVLPRIIFAVKLANTFFWQCDAGSVENQWGLYFPFLYPPNNTLIPLVIDRCNEIYILYFAFVDVY